MLSERSWHTDHLPIAWHQVSAAEVVIGLYKAILLVWAIWLVLSLVHWLRWGWLTLTVSRGPSTRQRHRTAFAVAHPRESADGPDPAYWTSSRR